MKNIMEHMVTTLIMVVILFVFTSVMLCELQIENARNLHTTAVNQIQSSYYTADIDGINVQLQEKFGDGWSLTAEKINSVNSRQDYLVTLNYKVYMPIFNISKTGVIQGYAR